MACLSKSLIAILFIIIFFMVSLGFSSYNYVDHYENYSCGNLKTGVGIGVSSLFIFLVSLILYIITCCNSCFYHVFMVISALYVMFSSGLNGYYYYNISDECVDYYKQEDLWEFYELMLISLLVALVVSVTLVITIFCC